MNNLDQIIKSCKANLEHARQNGNADSIIYYKETLAELEAKKARICQACDGDHTGMECPNAHGGWE